MQNRTARSIVVAIAIIFGFSCSGSSGCNGCGGCGTVSSIPGGFPPSDRVANAVQLRVTSSALTKLTADPASLLGGLLGTSDGSGVIQYPVSSCGSPSICCPMSADCGPIDIDLNLYPGDLPRFQLTPQNTASPNGELDVTLRARIKTANPLDVDIDGIDCSVTLDTTQGSAADLTIGMPISLDQDTTAGTTKVALGSANVTGLEGSDYTISGGGGLCGLASYVISPSTLEGYLAGPLSSAVGGQLGAVCRACATAADCEPFGTACGSGECMEGSACLQEIGIDGLMQASSLLASFSPTTTGGLEIYEVAGGYSTTADTGATGVSLGMLGGMQPGGSARDMCGPPASPPVAPTITRSAYFEGNTRPDNGSAFDVGIGLHASQLAELAWAGYEGGLFCLNVDNQTSSQLDTSTLGLVAPSLGNLVDVDSPMAVGIRPQSPPVISLGDNTFTVDGSGNRTLTSPLLDVKFSALEIDFFVQVDYQKIRAFTVVTDLDLPIGLDIGTSTLTPVLGDTSNSFTNISVKNSEAVTETPTQLAAVLPSLLTLVLPQLTGSLPTISLPSLLGFSIAVDSVSAVDGSNYLGIFAHLDPGATMDAEHLTDWRIESPTDVGRAARPVEKLADDAPADDDGVGCNAAGGGSSVALVLAVLLLVSRKRVRALAALAVAMLAACHSNTASNPCGPVPCMTGSLSGSLGRFTSVTGDDKRVMVATYDAKYGDLVVGDATDATNIKYITVDGVPDETPTYDPSTWRGGVTDNGPDVGAWTSIALANHTARVAYQDRDHAVLKYAFESSTGGSWQSYVVDPGHGEQIGQFTKMIIDGGNQPAIAYLAIGVDDGMGHRTTELRLARATGQDPQSATEWTITTIASAIGSCAGLCATTDACVTGSAGETCITPTADCGSACASGDVCDTGTCTAPIAAPAAVDIPAGTGLFDSMVVLHDGRLAVTYYDHVANALVISVESGDDTNDFSATVLDGGTAGTDRGRWTSAAVASDGTVHIAYQEAMGNQLMYTTWKDGTIGTPVVVDDGVRAGDRPHNVGASAALWLVNDAPVIAYQDGLVSDVDEAKLGSGNAWTTTDIGSGATLAGFWISATTGHGAPVVGWDSMDPTMRPPHTLVIEAAP